MKHASSPKQTPPWRLGLPATLLAAVALLGFGIPKTAHAQIGLGLNSGDSLTVTGAGSVGTLGGVAVNNPTSTYSDSQRTSTAVYADGTSSFTLGAGGTISVSQTGSYALTTNGSSAVMVGAGTIDASVYQGHALTVFGGGSVRVSGGTITGGPGGSALFVDGPAPVTVTGGHFSIGANSYTACIRNAGTINLFSQNDTPFLINGVAMNHTSVGQINLNETNTISGTLLNGDRLNTTFFNTGTIKLNIYATAPRPTVLIITPDNNSQIPAGNDVTLRVVASEPGGRIDHVSATASAFGQTIDLGSVSTPDAGTTDTYSETVTIPSYLQGQSATLTVTAFDAPGDIGNSGSDSISVSVVAPAPGPFINSVTNSAGGPLGSNDSAFVVNGTHLDVPDGFHISFSPAINNFALDTHTANRLTLHLGAGTHFQPGVAYTITTINRNGETATGHFSPLFAVHVEFIRPTGGQYQAGSAVPVALSAGSPK